MSELNDEDRCKKCVSHGVLCDEAAGDWRDDLEGDKLELYQSDEFAEYLRESDWYGD